MVGKGRSMGSAMREAGYSDVYADQPGKLASTKTFQELAAEILSDDKLIKVADEGLSAWKVQTSPTEGDKVVDDFAVRQRYLETALKVRGLIIDRKDLTTKGEKINPSFTVATKEAKESLEQLYAGSNSTDDKGIPR